MLFGKKNWWNRLRPVAWVFVCTRDTYTVRMTHTHTHTHTHTSARVIHEHVQVRGNRCTSGSSTRKGAGSLDTAVSTAGNSAEAASRPVEPRLPSGERHIFFDLSSIFTERSNKKKKKKKKKKRKEKEGLETTAPRSAWNSGRGTCRLPVGKAAARGLISSVFAEISRCTPSKQRVKKDTRFVGACRRTRTRPSRYIIRNMHPSDCGICFAWPVNVPARDTRLARVYFGVRSYTNRMIPVRPSVTFELVANGISTTAGTFVDDNRLLWLLKFVKTYVRVACHDWKRNHRKKVNRSPTVSTEYRIPKRRHTRLRAGKKIERKIAGEAKESQKNLGARLQRIFQWRQIRMHRVLGLCIAFSSMLRAPKALSK